MRAARSIHDLRGESGAAVVEFALVLPLVLILVFGIIDVGRLMFTANSLTSAVREGARFAAVQTNPTSGNVYTHISAQMNAAVSPAVTAGQVILDRDEGNRTVTVRINNYQFTPITPFANLTGFGTIRLSPSATLRWERAP
jgi:Flp pilus assembly protein TadG